MQDVEALVQDHSMLPRPLESSPQLTIPHPVNHCKANLGHQSKLKFLVPSIGTFFTPLPLAAAFAAQDARRSISKRRLVAPSFNDVRLILNSAQVMALVAARPLGLVTFDGDVTLYNDGECLHPDNPVIPRIIALMAQGTRVGIVTAAGYTDAERYHARLFGLLDAVAAAPALTDTQKQNLVVMGGEANYLFAFDASAPHKLRPVQREQWALEKMSSWTEENIAALLDAAGAALTSCVHAMNLPAKLVRKARAIGIVPAEGTKLTREQLEETVLVTQRMLDANPAAGTVPFCAFNGGNDVFVDIGDKSYGVAATQRFFGGIEGAGTLHVGDQFLSAGANDFKARLVCCTAWIACPDETVALLDEMRGYLER